MQISDGCVDVALQAPQLDQLIQQYKLSRIVKAASAPQAVHCALQLSDRRLLLDTPRGFARRERAEQPVCK